MPALWYVSAFLSRWKTSSICNYCAHVLSPSALGIQQTPGKFCWWTQPAIRCGLVVQWGAALPSKRAIQQPEVLTQVKHNSDALSQTDVDPPTTWPVTCPALQLHNDHSIIFPDPREHELNILTVSSWTLLLLPSHLLVLCLSDSLIHVVQDLTTVVCCPLHLLPLQWPLWVQGEIQTQMRRSGESVNVTYTTHVNETAF